MRVIFLDFDGVVNTPATWGRHVIGDGRSALDPDKVGMVACLCERMDAYVVISSAWRHDRTLTMLRDMLTARGFVNAWAKVIGVTPNRIGERGDEIVAWLQEHPDVDEFVVLDDNDDMRGVHDRFVKTDWHVGISRADVDAAAVHLARSRRIAIRNCAIIGRQTTTPQKRTARHDKRESLKKVRQVRTRQ